jgi:hypothetical protein
MNAGWHIAKGIVAIHVRSRRHFGHVVAIHADPSDVMTLTGHRPE